MPALRNRLLSLLLLPLLLSARPAVGGDSDTRSAPVHPRQSESRLLHALFDEQWDAWMQENPTWASSLGDRRWNDRWGDSTLAALETSQRADLARLARLEKLDARKLDAGDRINYELLRRRLREDTGRYRFRTFLLALNQRGGVQTEDELAEQLRFETVRDYEDWIARLRDLPRHVAEQTALLREGIRTGMVHPRVIMERVPAQIENQVVADPERSPFWKPFVAMHADISPEDAARLRSAARGAITAQVVPAYRAFLEFFRNDYLPATRASIGASELPAGRELYDFEVGRYTTTTLTAAQVHELGLKEVERIRTEMDAVMRQTGFAGSFEEFLDFLRTDPRFYYKTGEELLEGYRAVSKRADPELTRLFGRLPRMPYGVKPIPAETAADTTTAYYSGPAADGTRAGTFWVNLYRPEVRPRYEMEALTLHEAVPGHHLQIALAQELGELPRVRRYTGYTAFVEGWGLYAESLGSEMGFYQDPYSRFGQLTYEMWRAVRLVVDTGMHAMGWNRDRAIAFFKARAAKSEHDIVNEIDRYIAWPGQALAYKIGELKIKELRARARERLGDAFDVRGFHDVVLGSGAVPLDVLESQVDAWVAAASARSRSAAGSGKGKLVPNPAARPGE